MYTNHVEALFHQSYHFIDYAHKYVNYLSELLKSLDYQEVEKFVSALLKARDDGKTIYFIGNGGSAATASHFANDLGVGIREYVTPFRVCSLTDNNAVMTAIANDSGYDNVFLYQLQLHLNAGDVVVAISASGNSPNLLKAAQYVRQKEATIISLVGFDGGQLKDMSDVCIHVVTGKGEYGPVEDVHMVLDHLIGNYLYHYVRSSEKMHERKMIHEHVKCSEHNEI